MQVRMERVLQGNPSPELTSMPRNVVIVGAQWGDEGKGKVVDALAAHFDIVARYQGGANAGHTVVVEGKKFVLQLLPAGIVRPDKIAVIGNGLVIDPESLLREVEMMEKAGIGVNRRLLVSDRAHLILPYHRSLSCGRAGARRGQNRHHGQGHWAVLRRQGRTPWPAHRRPTRRGSVSPQMRRTRGRKESSGFSALYDRPA